MIIQPSLLVFHLFLMDKTILYPPSRKDHFGNSPDMGSAVLGSPAVTPGLFLNPFSILAAQEDMGESEAC